MQRTQSNPIGLTHGTVRLVPYSRQWIDAFDKERIDLVNAMGPLFIAVEHIGSTSIPGMQAKPIIDIAAMTEAETDVEKCIAPLAALGYLYRGEYGLPGRHFFTKGSPESHYLHVVVAGSHHWDYWMLFRDFLLRRGDIAEEYSRLKLDLAQKYAKERDAYTKAKSQFIVRVLDEARKERDAHAGERKEP